MFFFGLQLFEEMQDVYRMQINILFDFLFASSLCEVQVTPSVENRADAIEELRLIYMEWIHSNDYETW